MSPGGICHWSVSGGSLGRLVVAASPAVLRRSVVRAVRMRAAYAAMWATTNSGCSGSTASMATMALRAAA